MVVLWKLFIYLGFLSSRDDVEKKIFTVERSASRIVVNFIHVKGLL
jgi:hypothetical protein